ncbi:MAG TPA: flagellar basal body-associated protein FliL [Pseudomonadales bacterium]|nr:flagellar basal body-associated protein FliL [Pseudomonadales bacterium]
MKFNLWFWAFLLAVTPVLAADSPGLKDTTVLIIRHAEKPETGYDLTPVGYQRANAYVHYFKNFTIDGKPVTLDHLFAAADSKGSHRPRLTLEPLSKATGLAIDQEFQAKQYQELADALRAKPHGAHILICWHHGDIPQLLQALGAKPEKLLPGGKWPDNVFGWVIQLHYDDKGQLVEAKCINENLMPGDAGLQDDPVTTSAVPQR